MNASTSLPDTPRSEAIGPRLSEWLNEGGLAEALGRVQAQIRSQPAQADLRWVLFELLCVMGQWPRALQQLQTYAKLVPSAHELAALMHDLVRAEHQRAAVMRGEQAPGQLSEGGRDALPEWWSGLLQALAANARHDHAEADDLRAQALSKAPELKGQCGERSFAWISDSDSRLGPALELVSAGWYRWCALSDLSSLCVAQPSSLLHLVWVPADLVLRDGTPLKAWLPTRYSGSELSEDDGLRLARKTEWTELGQTATCGLGQKTWITDSGDLGLLDARRLRLGER